MIEEIKAKWVEALRSGKYTQARHALKGDRGFCCLGVLCDISGVGKWDEYSAYVCGVRRSTVGLTVPMHEYIGTNRSPYIPAANLTEEEKTLLGRDRPTRCICLTALNDAGISFERIADLIEMGLCETQEDKDAQLAKE